MPTLLNVEPFDDSPDASDSPMPQPFNQTVPGNDVPPQILEVNSDEDPYGWVNEDTVQGVKNIVVGATDTIGSIISQLFIAPFRHYDAAGKAIFNTLAGNTEQQNADLADNYLAEQSKMAAKQGIWKFLNYEPSTDAGAAISGAVMYIPEKVGAVTQFFGEHFADAIGAGVDNLAWAIRNSPRLPGKEWTAEDEYRLSSATVGAKASLQTLARVLPDAALLGLPALGHIRRRSREAGRLANADRISDGLQKTTMPFINLRGLENFNDKPLTPVEMENIRTQVNAGQFSTDISIETVGGKPVRILTGDDTVRSLQMMEQTQGVRVRDVKVRMVEKTRYSETELAELDTLGKLGFSDIISNAAKLDSTGKAQSLTFKEKLVRYGLDASGNLKKKLLEEAGPQGEAAVQALELAAGGTPRAALLYGNLKKEVWFKKGKNDPALGYDQKYVTKWDSKTKYSERQLFDYFLHADRALEIAKTKPGRVKTKKVTTPEGQVIETSKFTGYRLDGPITPSNASGILVEIKRLVGDKRYAQFEERGAHFYEGMKVALDRMKGAGLIDDAAYNKMKGLNYLTRRFSAEIDNIKINDGRLMTIGDSGIPYLKHGTKDRAFFTDVEAVAAEHIARAERRIARNDATRALAAVAESGQVDWIRPFDGKRVPAGYKEIKYLESGKSKSLLMTEKMAAEWTYGDLGVNFALAEIMRITSGSTLVKALATGYNPEFAVRNIIRDVQHAWRATGTQFSSFAPIYAGQLSVNLTRTAKDAFLKTGAYRDYVMEGGGFETLTHQGRNLSRSLDEQTSTISQLGYNKSKFAERLSNVKSALAVVGEFSELWVRLAIRDRVLMNQKKAGLPPDPVTATHVARGYLDFSQGGTLTKAIDTSIPYLNANVQAIRTGLRPYTQGGKMAAVTAFKDLQIIGAKAWLQSRFWNGSTKEQEAMRMVSDETLISNFIYPLGMHIVDDDGVVKPLVLQFPIDNSIVPLSGPLDLLIKKANTGENPSKALLDLLRAANPIGVTPTVPTVQAFLGYATNYNFYTNDQIWKGKEVYPGYEYTDNTPEFYKLLGQLAPNSISPERLQYMSRTLAPSNTYIYNADYIANLMLEEEDPAIAKQMLDNEKYQATEELLTRAIGFRRLVKILEPAEAMSQIEKQTLQQMNTEMKLLDDEYNAVVRSVTTFGLDNPQGLKPYQQLVKKVAQNYADRPDIQEKMTDTYRAKIAADVAWNKVVGKREMYFPSKETWIQLSMRQPEERANIFYGIWRTKKAGAERDKMFAIAAMMDTVAGKGTILSDRFWVQFEKRKAKFGEDDPLVLDGE